MHIHKMYEYAFSAGCWFVFECTYFVVFMVFYCVIVADIIPLV